jgi:hypothetical protein
LSALPVSTDSWPARFSAQLGIIALICLSILAPPIPITSQLWVRPEQVALPVAVLIYLWLLLTGHARLARFNGVFVVGIAFCAATLLSTWYGSEFLHHRVIARDFFELAKSLLPVAFFTFAYEADFSEKALHRVFGFFGASVVLVCIYAWAQWMNLGFTQALNAYYSALNHDSALYYARRVYSTLGNPNILGELMCWSLMAFLLAAIFRVGGYVRNAALALASLVTLIMTGSRYALLNAAFGLMLILASRFASDKLRRSKRLVLLAFVPVLIITFVVVGFSNQRTLDRYLTLERPLQADSLRGRVDRLWIQPWADFLQSPYLGHGPEKSVYTDVITDSEFLDIARKFGMVGFLVYLGYFLYPLLLTWKGLRVERRCPLFEECLPAAALTLRLGFVMGITALAMNIGMSTFTNLSLQGFLWIWLGLAAACARTARSIVRPVEQLS